MLSVGRRSSRSAWFYLGIIATAVHLSYPWGSAVAFSVDSRQDTTSMQARQRRRELPEKLLIGYATHCSEKVMDAVREGVNVVIWAFVEMGFSEHENEGKPRCTSTFDIFCAKEMIAQLDAEGYDDTVHLVSFGGWNGPHLPDSFRAEEMYNEWKELVDGIFHGVDWDLEGHDRLDNPTNLFSLECLESMGRFSELAQNDGFIVGMAPPQSYLDIEESRFSRYVNLTDPKRHWHDDFHYFGHNVYAYLLSRYGDSIDFVSIQFYESYARAGLEVFDGSVPPAAYLQNYVRDLVSNRDQSFFVDFDQDPSLEYSSRMVPFPLSKLVFGFANGWGATDDDKVCYFDPKDIAIAYDMLVATNQSPRGFMFWVIDEEGTKDIHFSRRLNDILKIRNKKGNDNLCDAKDKTDSTISEGTLAAKRRPPERG